MRNSRGQALVGAMVAVFVTSMVGTVVASNYSAIRTQSRRAYVQAAMTTLDAKIRYMATQPYAYACGADIGTDVLGGIKSCQVNPDYFKAVTHVLVPGVPCAPNVAACGFDVSPPVLKAVDVGGQTKMLLNYRVKYEGTDFSFRDLGFEANTDTGLQIPTELMQSGLFNCSVIDPMTPIFAGFTAQGRPDCRKFKVCPVGQHVRAVQAGALDLTCEAPANTNLDCGGEEQRRVGQVEWADGKINASCVALPEAKFEEAVYVVATPTCTDQEVLKDNVCVPKPADTCADVTFTINEIATYRHNGDYDRAFSAQLTLDFTPHLSKIPAGCKASTYDATFTYWSSANNLTNCTATAVFTNVPAGTAPIMAPGSCTRCGGNGTKYQQAWFNVGPDGKSATASNTGLHWGDGGGSPTSACVKNPTITIHSVPK